MTDVLFLYHMQVFLGIMLLLQETSHISCSVVHPVKETRRHVHSDLRDKPGFRFATDLICDELSW